MTYSNGAYSPHPLANPFNTRLGPSNYSLNPLCGSFCKFNSKCKDLPDPVMLSWSKEDLHAPAEDIPMRDFLAAYEQRVLNAVWRDEDIFSLKTAQSGMQLTQKDIAYWKHAEEQSQKLSAEMTDFQHKMLAYASSIFPKSKLEDVAD